MSLVKTNKLRWINLLDTSWGIIGITLVKRGFEANLHRHKEEEVYFFLWGTGKLYLDGYLETIKSPCKITINSNSFHAMTPITSYVVLLYYFPKSGPFETIKYKYLSSKL